MSRWLFYRFGLLSMIPSASVRMGIVPELRTAPPSGRAKKRINNILIRGGFVPDPWRSFMRILVYFSLGSRQCHNEGDYFHDLDLGENVMAFFHQLRKALCAVNTKTEANINPSFYNAKCPSTGPVISDCHWSVVIKASYFVSSWLLL